MSKPTGMRRLTVPVPTGKALFSQMGALKDDSHGSQGSLARRLFLASAVLERPSPLISELKLSSCLRYSQQYGQSYK